MIKFLFWEKCRFTYHCKKWSRKVLGTFHYFHFVIAQPGYWHQYRQGTECFSHCKEPSCSPHTHPAWVPSRSFSRKQQVFWKPKLEHVAPCLKPVNSFSLPSRQNHRSLAASPSLPICLPLPLALTLQFHKTSVQLCSLRCHSSSCKEAPRRPCGQHCLSSRAQPSGLPQGVLLRPPRGPSPQCGHSCTSRPITSRSAECHHQSPLDCELHGAQLHPICAVSWTSRAAWPTLRPKWRRCRGWSQ